MTDPTDGVSALGPVTVLLPVEPPALTPGAARALLRVLLAHSATAKVPLVASQWDRTG